MDSTQYRMGLYRSDNELLHKYDTNYVTFPVAAHIAQCLVGVTGGDGAHVQLAPGWWWSSVSATCLRFPYLSCADSFDSIAVI